MVREICGDESYCINIPSIKNTEIGTHSEHLVESDKLQSLTVPTYLSTHKSNFVHIVVDKIVILVRRPPPQFFQNAMLN